MSKRQRPEQELQKACVDYLLKCAHSGLFWTAINPIAQKPIHIASLSKKLGMIAGVPDMLFIWDSQVFFVEFKDAKGSLSKSQKLVHERLREQPVNIYTVKSLDEFIHIIEKECFK